MQPSEKETKAAEAVIDAWLAFRTAANLAGEQGVAVDLRPTKASMAGVNINPEDLHIHVRKIHIWGRTA